MILNRRRALVGLASMAGLYLGGRQLVRRVARAAEPETPLSPEAKALVARAWEGIDPAKVIDTHVHLVGVGTGGTGCFVHPHMLSLFHPFPALKFAIYLRASGVKDQDQADQQYVDRLALLVRAQMPRPRLLLLPFDQVYDPDGTARPDLSEMHTPNDYALKVAREHPDVFLPGASVHPYRRDAADELERCIEAGALALKWLPNAQGIDPSSEKCDPVYRVLARRGVPLISHGGEEQAVDADEAQALGNPLLLRRALDLGVKVIVAHGASLGTDLDLDAPELNRPRVSSQELLFRMMEHPDHRELLFADLSAVCQANRCGEPLRKLLRRTELHPRFVNGSDYPLPAINALVRTSTLENHGYFDAATRELLNELDRHNPLLFDFVTKRTLALTEPAGSYRFSAASFQVPEGLFPLRSA